MNTLKNIFRLIEEGASGFDILFAVENNENIPTLHYDGISFYEMFKEIGNQKVKEIPNKMKKSYKSFITVEDTDKGIFMEWLKKTIDALEKAVKPNDDYVKYKEQRKNVEMKKGVEYCRNCGAKISNPNQKICENCGVLLR
ncbi:MAG: hypothetical protein BAJALOKI2v1_90071 [Promethearchaeota archaeon]|nr:MAG: hypothetical protein BAJALOKI2v1_90071 [Candidatus Lokiarchaeota archaeon]